MTIPFGAIIQGASRARTGYSQGQQEGQQEALQRAMQQIQLQRQAQEQSLRDALTKAQTQKLLMPPPPVRDYVKEHELNRDYDINHPLPTKTGETSQQHVVDPVTGEVVFFDPKNPPKGLKVHPAPDRSTIVVADPNNPTGPGIVTRRQEAIGQHEPATSRTSEPQQGERQAAAMLPEVEDALHKIDAMTPDLLSQTVTKVPIVGNYIKTDKGRQFEQMATQFINNTVYLKSGKAITDQEFARLKRELIPEPGDDQKTLNQKRNARQLFVQGAYIMAGRAAKQLPGRGGGSGTPQNPTAGNITLPQNNDGRTTANASADPEFDALMAKYRKKP